jgi:hypothetical protein
MREITDFVIGFRFDNSYLIQYPYEVVEEEQIVESYERGDGYGYSQEYEGIGEYNSRYSKYSGIYKGNNYAYLKQIYSYLPSERYWTLDHADILIQVIKKVEIECKKKKQLYFPNATFFSNELYLEKFIKDINEKNEWKYNANKSIPSYQSNKQTFKNSLCLLFSDVFSYSEETNVLLETKEKQWSFVQDNRLNKIGVNKNDLLYVQRNSKKEYWFFPHITDRFWEQQPKFYHSLKNNPNLSTLSEHIQSFLPKTSIVPEIGAINQMIEKENFQKRMKEYEVLQEKRKEKEEIERKKSQTLKKIAREFRIPYRSPLSKIPTRRVSYGNKKRKNSISISTRKQKRKSI